MRFTKFCDIKPKFFCIIFSFSISVKSVKTHFETISLLFSILSTIGLSTPTLILWYDVPIRLSTDFRPVSYTHLTLPTMIGV